MHFEYVNIPIALAPHVMRSIFLRDDGPLALNFRVDGTDVVVSTHVTDKWLLNNNETPQSVMDAISAFLQDEYRWEYERDVTFRSYEIVAFRSLVPSSLGAVAL